MNDSNKTDNLSLDTTNNEGTDSERYETITNRIADMSVSVVGSGSVSFAVTNYLIIPYKSGLKQASFVLNIQVSPEAEVIRKVNKKLDLQSVGSYWAEPNTLFFPKSES